MNTFLPVSELLQSYLEALTAKDIDSIENLFGNHCLLEIPFIKPNRLVGKAEIVEAHREIFGNLTIIEFKPSHIHNTEIHAIAEGELAFTRDGDAKQSIQAAIVAEVDRDRSQRISLYCDARNIRPWSDKTIL